MQAQSINTTTLIETERGPSRFSAGALVTGGTLMITMYALQIVHGLRTGEVMNPENATVEPLLMLSALSFCGGLLVIALALASLGSWMRSRSPKLAVVALVLASIASIAPALNILATLVGMDVPDELRMLNGLSVLCNLGSATLLGIAVLRTKALSKSIGITLVAVGLATFPLILLTIPAEQMMPAYVAMDLPFPGWGAIFTGLGVALLRNRR